MFERFTESARRAIVLAQDESRALRHDHIGAEHLLLGLARESSGGAARALAASRAPAGALVQAVRGTVGEGKAEASGQMPFTADVKRALELALTESHALGYSYIATEHLLLGLLAADTEVVRNVLAVVHANPQRVREETLRILEDTKPLQEPVSRRDQAADVLELASSPAAAAIWKAAAARALQAGRGETAPTDVLAAALSDGEIARLLAGAGYDAAAILAALEAPGREG